MLKGLLNTDVKQGSANVGLLILRLAVGGLMLTHGWGKFLRLLDGKMKFADPIGLGPEVSLVMAVFAEFVCSILIIIGFATRISAMFGAFTMGVAAFIVHADDDIGTKEKALLFFAMYVVLIIMGGGRYSLDRKFD